ncbi:hypothetical protein B488_08050 [Liberibacter crescens BT-1]|uniref:Uncharacterized protein n=1 Tax=Liberibacter crescens (strain BT-1) TaxID=1215343 RepID=L0EV08_LIBCB|nr:hypothetical protein B488_08050 [Liberibacter crescens BT-1]
MLEISPARVAIHIVCPVSRVYRTFIKRPSKDTIKFNY